jgi:hypothetical protein
MSSKRPDKVSPTVRVTARTRDQLRRLSATTGRSAPDLLEEAVDLIEQERMLEAANEAFAALRADPAAWEEEMEERRAWHGVDADRVDED